MAWRGSISRSVIATARASTIRTSPPLPRLRPPSLATPRLQSRRLSFTNPREWRRWVTRSGFSARKAEQQSRIELEQIIGSAPLVQQILEAVIASRRVQWDQLFWSGKN